MKPRHLPALSLAVALSLPLAAGAGEGFQVIANAASSPASVTRGELARVFLKRTTRWPGGEEIRPVEPRAGGAARAAFDAQVLGMSAGALRSYWSKMVFSGRDVPPVEKESDAEVVAFVRDHPGAIGYVSPGADAAGLKVVEVRP